MELRSNYLEEVIDRVAQWSVMPLDRLRVIAAEASEVIAFPGSVAELGVHRGGSTLLLAAIFSPKPVHAFDSFEGLTNLSVTDDLVRVSPNDRGHSHRDFAIENPDEVKRIEARLLNAGVTLHRGDFKFTKDEAATFRFCFAHFDADTYRSAQDFLEFFFPRMVPGGKIIIDDYNWKATPGVTRAVDEFTAARALRTYRPSSYQAMLIIR